MPIQSYVQEAMDKLIKATLVIAHRLHTVIQANIIHVVEKGAIVESGNHADLMARAGRYAQFYAMRFSRVRGASRLQVGDGGRLGLMARRRTRCPTVVRGTQPHRAINPCNIEGVKPCGSRRTEFTFNCEIDGPEGAPWIMFSNSLATNLSMWNPQVADFEPSLRVLRYDRGHGEPRRRRAGCTYPPVRRRRGGPARRARNPPRAFRRPVHGRSHRARARRASSPTGSTTSLSASSPACRPRPAPSNGRSASPPRRGKAAWRRWCPLAHWFPPETLATKPAHVERVPAMILSTPVNGFIGGAAALSDHDYNAAVATVARDRALHRRQQGRRHAGSDEGHAPARRLTLRRTRRRRTHFRESRSAGGSPTRCGNSSG